MMYYLIGERLGYSYSKIIHNILGNKDYELMEISPDSLDGFFEVRNFRGINVTAPYKQKVLKYCKADSLAGRIGSVNTVVNTKGLLLGYNTDYNGFIAMGETAGVSFKNKKIMILGNGGTAQTARIAAFDGGAREVAVISRSGVNNYENLRRHYDSQIIVNTTPVGLFPDNYRAPVDIAQFKNLSDVIDVNYNPLKTKLIMSAEAAGINYGAGLEMLTAQAISAHNLFFGLNDKQDIDLIKEITLKIKNMLRNIVLIGMPGCGKSTIGEKLAGLLKLDFIDTDLEVARRIGKSPERIISEQGESSFRALESKVILDIAKKTGLVVATGGGSVLLSENREALAQNGFIVFLDKGIDRLDTKRRPLSEMLDEMHKIRYPVYNGLCHAKVCMSDDIDENIANILEAI